MLIIPDSCDLMQHAHSIPRKCYAYSTCREIQLSTCATKVTDLPTLIEILQKHGYYQGVTHKLHVVPNSKFPYDAFINGQGTKELAGFVRRAQSAGKPWFYFNTISVSHRPFPNSDRVPIRVNPAKVVLPRFLPDTPIVRKDWAEYLAAIEAADQLVGETLAALAQTGQQDRTIILLLGDHGPALELYDLQTDPDELRNLAGEPAYAGQLDRLQRALKKLAQTTSDRAVHF